jgi:CubicO group peptidase (beta-lactamase class C family)
MKNPLSMFLAIIILAVFSEKSVSQSVNQVDTVRQQETAFNVARQFLEIVNSGDRDSIESFVSKTYDTNALKKIPLSAIVTFNLAIYLESGGLGYNIKQINSVNAGSISIEVYNRLTDCDLTLRIPTTGAPYYKINNIIMPDFSPTNTENKQSINNRELLKRLNICLKKVELEKEFSGVILLAHNDNVLIKKSIGMANICYEVPIQSDTKFNIASVGKMFTAVAIAKLVEDGKLTFDDTINKYIPSDWINPMISNRIQVKHLLTHTSGLGDYFTEVQKQCNILYFRELNDYKPLVVNDTLRFNPGTRFSYSNTGLLLAGVIIEKVSHESYFSYLKNNIFIPLGMNNTDGFDKDFPAQNTATGYTKVIDNGEVKWNNNQYTRIMRGSPSGGIYSTAEDLMKFASAIRNNKLFSPEYQEILIKPRPELSVSFHSYLFFNSTDQNNRQISHSGDGQGTNCYFKMFLDSGYTYIILSNMSRPSANILAVVLDQLLSKY